MFLASLCTAVFLFLSSPLLPLTYSQHTPTTVLFLCFLCLISRTMVSISAASASTSSLSSYASMHTTEPDKWFSIRLQDPFVLLTHPNADSASSSSSSSFSSSTLNGTIHIRLSKPTKVRSLSLNLSGFARTSFRFDSARIPGAKACAPIGKTGFITLTSFYYTAPYFSRYSRCSTPISYCFSSLLHLLSFSTDTADCGEMGTGNPHFPPTFPKKKERNVMSYCTVNC